jgi:hypothetical protein
VVVELHLFARDDDARQAVRRATTAVQAAWNAAASPGQRARADAFLGDARRVLELTALLQPWARDRLRQALSLLPRPKGGDGPAAALVPAGGPPSNPPLQQGAAMEMELPDDEQAMLGWAVVARKLGL